ncbi:putative uridine nucleosidase 2 [Drosera capensis]
MVETQKRKKIIIDTDPGIATTNTLHLVLQTVSLLYFMLEVAGRNDFPVAEGSHVTLTKGTKLRIANFVHGTDGFGNLNFPTPKGKPIEQSGVDFLIEQAKLFPGEVTVVALGPLTNIALAVQLDPSFSKNVKQIIFGDPYAADVVFTSGADILAVGINVTHQVVLTKWTDKSSIKVAVTVDAPEVVGLVTSAPISVARGLKLGSLFSI